MRDGRSYCCANPRANSSTNPAANCSADDRSSVPYRCSDSLSDIGSHRGADACSDECSDPGTDIAADYRADERANGGTDSSSDGRTNPGADGADCGADYESNHVAYTESDWPPELTSDAISNLHGGRRNSRVG
jgi:hypothetical protein